MTTPSEDGFSLIEVLISLFILTVGVIGAAGMQLSALQTTRWSAYQTTALHLALEMADHIKVHGRYAKSGDATTPYLAIDYQHSGNQPAPLATSNCYGRDANCNAEQLINFEIALWMQRLSKEIPAARVRVCRDMQPWDAGRQRYTWDCTTNQEASSDLSVFIKIGWPGDALEAGASQNGVNKDFPPVLVLSVAAHRP
jgi:type IV pilus assembly protein PilV